MKRKKKKTVPIEKQRVKRTRANGTKTEAEFVRHIKCFLRKHSMHWRPYSYLRSRKVIKGEHVVNEKTGKLEPCVICEGCNKKLAKTASYVDHKEPVVPEGKTFRPTFMPDYDETKHVGADYVIGHMFVEEDGLQLLCKSCHEGKGTMSYGDWLQSKTIV